MSTTDQICAVLDFARSENQEKCQDVTANTWVFIYILGGKYGH